MTVQTLIDEIRKRAATGDPISAINPATEDQITEFTDCGAEAVNEPVARARAPRETGVWSEHPERVRGSTLAIRRGSGGTDWRHRAASRQHHLQLLPTPHGPGRG